MPALGALFALAILALTAPVVVDADTFTLSDTYQGSGFLSGFSHEAISDPTHGRVYVSTLLPPCPCSPSLRIVAVLSALRVPLISASPPWLPATETHEDRTR